MVVPTGWAAAVGLLSLPSSALTWVACALPSWRLVRVRRLTEAMLAKPSPRKPMLATCSKSFKVLILLVAWRWSASSMSSGWMPLPLSLTRIRRMPPPASSTSIAVAPASILFSTISFRALAGRSTTSPAAIWLTRWSGRAAIRDIGFFQKSNGGRGNYRYLRINSHSTRTILFSCNTAVPSDS